MRIVRNVLSPAAAVGLALSLIPMLPGQARAQSSQITVLVAPLIVADGVDRNFGRDVARRVRDALEDFGGLTPIEEGDVEDFLDQYNLDWRNLSAIEWRQIAGQMQASMVMIGTAESNGQGIAIDVAFLDPRTGDELPVEPFTLDDDDDEAAADRITADLGVGVEYQRSLVFCAEYLASEEVEDALRNCNAALEVNPNSMRALYLRGRIHMLEEAWGAAAEDLERVVEAEASNTEALQSLAYTHAQLGNKERSVELYKDYLTFNPDDVSVRLQIVFELVQAGAHAEAVQILEDGLQRAPDNVDMLEYLGNVALRAGQENGEITDPEMIRRAVAAFEKVLDIRGDQIAPTTLTNVINAYMLIEEYDQALAFADRAIALINNPPAATADTGAAGTESEIPEDPEQPQMSKDQLLAQVYAARSNVYSRQDMHAEAAAELDRALELDQEIPSGYQRLGLAKLRSGDEDGAIAAFRRSVEQGANPDDIANALFGQGYSDHFQQGRYQEAIRLFDVAAEFAQAPENVHQIQFFIGYGHYQRGTRIDEANAQDEACQPARQALNEFQQVIPHLDRAGQYQASSQGDIREAVDVQLYRQQQIIRAACS